MSNLFYIKIYTILSILFLISGVGLFWFNKRKNNSKYLRTKYWVYFFIVSIHYFLLQYSIEGFRLISILFLIIGGAEVYKLSTILYKKKKYKGILISILIYASICFSYFNFINLDLLYILFVYSVVIVFDGFSQLSGVLFGKTQLIKTISPGKTWEGLIGGILGALLMFVVFRSEFEVNFIPLFIFWLVILCSSFVGDLLASLFKRHAGIKDFSKIIPGHGGVLDRFDGLFMAGALSFLFTIYFLK